MASRGDGAVHADVGVVGAGIAGLSVAALLARQGVRVEVLEQAERPRASGAGVMLHPNALIHLAHLRPELSRISVPIVEQMTSDVGGSGSVVRWASVWSGERLPRAVHRPRLAELMLSRLPSDVLRWATRPTEISQDKDAVTVRLPDGTWRRYLLLVGADGVNSRVREAVCPGVAPTYLGSTYWRTTVERAEPYDFPEWRVWRSRGRFFGAMPVGGGLMHVFVQDAVPWPPPGHSEDPARWLRELAVDMGGEAADFAAELRLTRAVHVDPALGLLAPDWVRDRVVLVGDAAHAVAPATTQGAGLALEDAGVLVEEILRHGPGTAALAAFVARRRARVSAFVRLSRLHAALLPSLEGRRPGERRAGDVDASTWFRRLYAPLMDAA